MNVSQTVLGYACALSAVAIWSGFILVSRQGGLSALTPFDVIAIRYTVCATLLLPVWAFYRFKLWQPKLVISSLVGALLYALFAFQGFALTPASHSAILLPGIMPLAITLLSVWLLNTQVTGYKWLGISLITAGIGLLLIEQLLTEQASDLTGHSLITAAALCWALYSVLLSKWAISPLQATISLSIITFLLYMPVYLVWLPKNITSAPFHDIALQGFYQGFLATIIQMLLYVRAVQLIGAPAMGSMMALVPTIAGLAAIALFNEVMHPSFVITLILVSVGVWLANRPAANNPVSNKFANQGHSKKTSNLMNQGV